MEREIYRDYCLWPWNSPLAMNNYETKQIRGNTYLETLDSRLHMPVIPEIRAKMRRTLE